MSWQRARGRCTLRLAQDVEESKGAGAPGGLGPGPPPPRWERLSFCEMGIYMVGFPCVINSLLASIHCPLGDGRSSLFRRPRGCGWTPHTQTRHTSGVSAGPLPETANKQSDYTASLPQGSPGLCKHHLWWSSGSLHGPALPPPVIQDPWSTPLPAGPPGHLPRTRVFLLQADSQAQQEAPRSLAAPATRSVGLEMSL